MLHMGDRSVSVVLGIGSSRNHPQGECVLIIRVPTNPHYPGHSLWGTWPASSCRTASLAMRDKLAQFEPCPCGVEGKRFLTFTGGESDSRIGAKCRLRETLVPRPSPGPVVQGVLALAIDDLVSNRDDNLSGTIDNQRGSLRGL